MRTSLRYLLPVLLVSVGGGWWFLGSRPPIPSEMQIQNQQPVPRASSQPSQENVAPSATQSGTRPFTRLTPPQGAADTATPGSERVAASRAKDTGSLQAETADHDEVADNLRASLTSIGFSAQDIERILEIVFAPPADGLTDEDESPEAAEGIYAPGLDELADDFRARFTAAGFSPKDIERILEIVLAQPVDVSPAEEEDPEDVQEPSLDDLADDFQDRLMTAGFSPQDIADILQTVLAPPAEALTAADKASAELERANVPVHDLSPANLQARLMAAGFSPQEIAHILQTLLQPAGQQ